MKAKFVPTQSLLAICLFGFSLLLLAGCANEYSEDVVYKVRQDPLFPANKVPTKVYLYPDQPGQLPLRNVAMIPKSPPYAKLDPKTDRKLIIDPNTLSADHREQIKTTLDGMFGSPQEPLVIIPGTSNEDRLKLKLDPQTLARGSEVYRGQCLQCHGVTGDGRGYSAPWVNPHPRDYRLGLYKFQSTDQTGGEKKKPLRADLYRTLYEGVEGTSMPAFNLLPEEDLDALVSYVIHLSIRGESEATLIRQLVQNSEETKKMKNKEVDDFLKTLAEGVFSNWVNSQSQLIKIGPYPLDKGTKETERAYHTRMKASILRGQALFTNNPKFLTEYAVFTDDPKLLMKKISDLKGELYYSKKERAENKDLTDEDKKLTMAKKYEEDWKKNLSGLTTVYSSLAKDHYDDVMKALAKRANCVECHVDYGRQGEWKFDEWGTLVKPRNITRGNFRGGRRPVDVYYRIHSGINGSNMTQKGDVLHSNEIWDLVNFVQAAPYEGMRKSFGINLK